jgi:glycosyltransferase involved in cell wall biosynthesis
MKAPRDAAPTERSDVLRVAIFQPVLARYRRALFHALGSRPGLDLEVWAGREPWLGSIPSVAPTSAFRFREAPVHRRGPLITQPHVLAAVASGRFDVIVHTWNVHHAESLPAAALMRLRGGRLLLWGHGFSTRDSRQRRQTRNLLARAADGVIVYNEWARQLLLTDGLPPERVWVAPNALDPTDIAAARSGWLATPGRLSAFQAREGIDPARLLLFVARIEGYRRLDLALEALARLRPRLPEITLAVVGEGPERAALVARAERLGIQARIRWLGAIFDEEQLAPWMLCARAMLHPEAIGLSMIHAHAYGLPVLTARDPLCHGPEYGALLDGWNGLGYRRGDVEDLAGAIERVVEDADLAAALREGASWSAVHGEMTFPRMVEGFRRALRGEPPISPAPRPPGLDRGDRVRSSRPAVHP